MKLSDDISYLREILTDRPKPKGVSINLTQQCNQRCRYCEIGNRLLKPEKPPLEFEDVCWVIDQMAEEGIPLIAMGGGEPLLVNWLGAILKYTSIKKVKTRVLTNGMRIRELNEEDLSSLKHSYDVLVSIDSIKPEHQDYLRGVPGALERQIQGIKILHREKIPYSVATVISDINCLDLLDLVSVMDYYGARFVLFQPVWIGSNYPGTDAVDKRPLIVTEAHIPLLYSQLQQVIEYEKTHAIKTNAGDIIEWIVEYLKKEFEDKPFFESFVNRYWCNSIHSVITINYYGEMLPCNYLTPRANIKNRKDGDSLSEMWNAVCEDSRQTLKAGQFFPECVYCTNNIEKSLICSGIRYPIHNFKIWWNIGKKIVKKREFIRR
jgi:MoaA/NifB/PqqE/SkfB family radical SAM enzyme